MAHMEARCTNFVRAFLTATLVEARPGGWEVVLSQLRGKTETRRQRFVARVQSWFRQGPGRSSGDALQSRIVASGLVLVFAGLVISILFVVDESWSRVLAVTGGVFIAAGFVGRFVGFLFGLPRDAPPADDSKPSLHFFFNSNLLKVSDFATTIIVGLTLTQLANVIPALQHLADALRVPLGDNPQSGAIGITLAISGFAGSASCSIYGRQSDSERS